MALAIGIVTLLGSLVSVAFWWIKRAASKADDPATIRLVKKAKGSFDNEVSSTGQHGDVFDALKLAHFALRPGGEFASASVKTTSHRPSGGEYALSGTKKQRFALA